MIAIFLSLVMSAPPADDADAGAGGKPLPAASSEYSVDVSDGPLAGTLLVPDAFAAGGPLVVIVAGSGPTDRDGNNAALKNDSLRKLAEGLARGGVASYRYDKRGVGGTPNVPGGEASLTPQAFAADVRAAAEALAAETTPADSEVAEPRFGRLTLLGHSEGSLLSLIAARSDAVDAVVSVAGPGRKAQDVLREQLKGKLPPPLDANAEEAIKALERGEDPVDVSPLLASLFRPSITGYLKAWFRLDPAAIAADLDKPLLIVQGGRDVQVSEADAELLKAARPDATLLVLPEMNHVFRDVTAEESPLTSYGQPERPIAPTLVEAVVRFAAADGD